MAHVFISYSSAHQDLTEQIAAYLEGCGLDVWWDRELVARGAVAQVSVMQGTASRSAAEALFMADRFYAGERTNRSTVRQVTDNIAKIYGRGSGLVPLEPDLIAEHHVALVADIDSENPSAEAIVAWGFYHGLEQARRINDALSAVPARTVKIVDSLIERRDKAAAELERRRGLPVLKWEQPKSSDSSSRKLSYAELAKTISW